MSRPNPFTPGAGYPPPFLAGRDQVRAAFSDHLARSVRLPRHFVLTGLRGTGKTVLLAEFQRICSESGWLCARRELDETGADTGVLLQAVAADLARVGAMASLGVRLKQAGRQVADLLRPRELEAFGVHYAPAYDHGVQAPARDQLVAALTRVKRVLCQSHCGLVLLYDEFHEIWDGRRSGQAPLATLLGAIKEVQLAGHPIIVVASGLPPLVAHIVAARSYLERDLNVHVLGGLVAPDARAAISEPLSAVGATFTDALVDRIVNDTRGYPYFLQYYAWFLLESAPEARAFDANVLDAILPALVANLDQSFFAGHFYKLPASECAALVSMARTGEQVRASSIPWHGNRSTLRKVQSRLVERGQLYRPSGRGELAFSLPLYRDFILRADLNATFATNPVANVANPHPERGR